MKLPVLSGKEVVKLAEKKGFKFIRQKGSHFILKNNRQLLVIPNHKRLKKGTLNQIFKILRIK